MESELTKVGSDKFTQTLSCHKECEQCIIFQNENRVIRNKLTDCKQELAKEEATVAELKQRLQSKQISNIARFNMFGRNTL